MLYGLRNAPLWNSVSNWWHSTPTVSNAPVAQIAAEVREKTYYLGSATADATAKYNIATKLAGAAWKYSGGQAVFTAGIEGLTAQIGRITRGTGGYSDNDFYSSYLQAAQSLPLGVGQVAQDFYGPINNAKSRMVSMYAALGRKGYMASEGDMRGSFERFLEEERRGKEVELTGERIANNYMSSEMVLAQSAERIAASVDRLITALAVAPHATNLLIRSR